MWRGVQPSASVPLGSASSCSRCLAFKGSPSSAAFSRCIVNSGLVNFIKLYIIEVMNLVIIYIFLYNIFYNICNVFIA